MSLTIRPVTSAHEDVAAFAELRSNLWPGADFPALLAEAQAFASGAEVPAIAAAFLATDAAEGNVGFIEVSIRSFADGCESQPIPHVEGWYVRPRARKRGIGRALMERAEVWAQGLGFTELASDTEIANGASIAAHFRCGFAETERLIKLRKDLPTS